MDDRRLSPGLAARFSAVALGHVRREYPNRLDQTLTGPGDLRAPSGLHPVFYGSYDWHSCVHSHWMLARLLRLFPDAPAAPAIRALFDAQFVPAKVEAERAHLAAPAARGFKRPYGWAWLLKLAEELGRHEDRRWAAALEPLARVFAGRFREFLPVATYPVRVGTHFNTAFGLRMAVDHAEATGDAGLAALLRGTAERWYGADADCPAWGEPGGDDFLSSALVEAECMRRLLPPERFLPWFDRFLPRIARGEPATLFRPAVVTDRSDGKIAHLDGLNLSRAWCWRSVASALPLGDARRARMQEAADEHLAAALPHIADDYMGEHWLATFAVLALEAERA